MYRTTRRIAAAYSGSAPDGRPPPCRPRRGSRRPPIPGSASASARKPACHRPGSGRKPAAGICNAPAPGDGGRNRSEEHTSELQSRENLVCRLLLEKKKNKENTTTCT